MTGSLIMIALVRFRSVRVKNNIVSPQLVLLASLMFGREFVTDVKKTQYTTILIMLAVAISLDTFFWIAIYVLWRNIREESPAQVDVIGKGAAWRTVLSVELQRGARGGAGPAGALRPGTVTWSRLELWRILPRTMRRSSVRETWRLTDTYLFLLLVINCTDD